MKAGMLTHDGRLKEDLLRCINPGDDEWHFFDEAEEAKRSILEGGYRKFVVSDRLFGAGSLDEWLEEIRERQSGTELIVMLSNRHDARVNEKFVKICLSADCRYIRPGLSIPAVIGEIREHVSGYGGERLPEAPGNQLFAFIGSTPNIGTTLISFGTAVRLAMETEQTVGYLCLNLKSSKLHRYLGREEPRITLDSLRADLRSTGLTENKLKQYCEKMKQVPRLHVLYGNLVREQAEYYTPEQVEHLLAVAREAFDVCIIDVNAYWDNAATVCSMLRADRRIVVTTPDLTHFQEDVQRWIKTVAAIYGLTPSCFDLVLNGKEESFLSGHVRSKDIRRETHMQPIGEVQRHSGIREYADEGRWLELFLGSHPINKELSAICGTLITLCGFRRAPDVVPHRYKRWRKALSIVN